jgi:fibronectin type 3 domain-containing protein
MRSILPALALALGAASPLLAAPAFPLRFDFGAAANEPGATLVDTSTIYSAPLGYGLASATGLSVRSGAADGYAKDALVGAKPFSFIVDLPEGNYDVVVHLGDPAAPSDTTVKAETRRLML